MMQELPLLVAAVVVGALHMSAPDHWATIAILGKARGWSHSRLMKTGIVTSVGHTALSLVLGFAVVGLGLIFSSIVVAYVTYAIGAIMLAFGAWYAAKALAAKGRFNYRKYGEERMGGGIGYFAILGAALSPDLSVLPIFLVAVPMGMGFALDVAAAFAASSIVTLLVLVYLGHILVEHSRFARRVDRMNPKYNDAMVGIVIALVGLYVLAFG